MAEIKIEGLDQVLDALREIEPKASKRIERKALRKALEPVKRETERRVPVGETGNLAESIKLTVRKGKKTKSIYGAVNANAPHAHLVELGHRIVTENGRDTGKTVPPHPFMRPALDMNAERVLQILADEIRDEIQKLHRSGR